MSKLGGVLKSAAHKLLEKISGTSWAPQMLGLEVTLYSNVGCSQTFRFFYFLKKKNIIKFGAGNFSDRSWLFVCSIRSNSCKTLEGPQLDLGPVEAVKGPKMAMLTKIGLVKFFKIGTKT